MPLLLMPIALAMLQAALELVNLALSAPPVDPGAAAPIREGGPEAGVDIHVEEEADAGLVVRQQP